MGRHKLNGRSLGPIDRAVSPVIGLILMVAITVVLAAAIGHFVLGLGQSAGNNDPRASLVLDADSSNDKLTISHAAGDGLEANAIRLLITNHSRNATAEWSPAETDGDVFSVGDRVEVIAGSPASIDPGTLESMGDGSGQADKQDPNALNPGIKRGVQYSVKLINTESGRIFFETQITA